MELEVGDLVFIRCSKRPPDKQLLWGVVCELVEGSKEMDFEFFPANEEDVSDGFPAQYGDVLLRISKEVVLSALLSITGVES